MRLNTKPAWIEIVIVSLVLLLGGCAGEKTVELGKTTLEKDTTWSGVVVAGGDVYVPPGVTLTVLPGTIVKFRKIDETSEHNLFAVDSPYYPYAELIVRGRLVARGTAGKPIVFTSAEIEARPADWGAINFLGSEGNVIEHAKIMCAYNGIHAHGSSVLVSDCEFVKNGVAISFKKEEETPDAPWLGKASELTITRNLISGNKGGIGLRNSKAVISHNEITDNKFFGIWPKEDVDARVTYNEISGNKKGVYLYQTRGLVLEYNNIEDNTDYNIGVAEAQDYPVEARNNWFGTINREKIEASIFDKKDDPDLGEVFFEPFLERQVRWEGEE